MSEIKVPELAESITEGTIAEWLVKVGDKVEKGDPIVELETDKVNVEVNSDYAGVITELLFGEGDDVEVGDVIAKVDETGSAQVSAPTEETPKEEAPASKDKLDVVASPATRKRARELGINLNELYPKDPLGRVRIEDVEAAARAKVESAKQAAKAPAKQAEKTEFDKPVEREKMSR